ncbi:cytochrome P450 6B5-like [Anticarsia gemmatalis]|uniref:cytochrome P450 6B5-like n=1 Tax=Anticarsia gemmatalis TaxID=129554 RepID=UPI003F76158B
MIVPCSSEPIVLWVRAPHDIITVTNMLALQLILALIAFIVLAVYCASYWRLQYWKRKNVPHDKPLPIVGNFKEYLLFKKYIGLVVKELCEKFPDVPYFGAYYGTEPTLVVKDPELIKTVMTKDFYYFSGRETSKYIHREMLMTNLFNTYGDQWKVLRQNLTPLFSSAKMKNMFHLIEKCSHVFEKFVDQEVKISDHIEARAFMARFTMDCIGSCAFGIDTNTMVQTEGNMFTAIGNTMFDTDIVRSYKNVTRIIWPGIFYALGFEVFPKQIEAFFTQLMTGIFEGRHYQPTSRNDFVDLLLKVKSSHTITGDALSSVKSETAKKVTLEVSDRLLVAQCFVFFGAGYETSASTLSFTMFELAKHPEIQERVLQEVDEYLRRNDNVLKYECVAEMPYLEACIDEALRLYPVMSVLAREVAENYTMPDGVRVDKGVRVHIPVYYLHYNPEFFPEPEKFKPERFYGENKRNVRPYTYMPFGDGPRVCLGMRFAKMQITAGFITLLKKYRVELAEGMPKTVKMEPRGFVTQPIGGLRLKFVEREGWEQRLLNKATV